MQVFIHVEGKEHEFNIKLPAKLDQLKQMIAKECGIPEEVQHLHNFPEIPANALPELNTFADDHTFKEHVLNKQVNCVLTFGDFSTWAYFYIHFQPGCTEKAVYRFKSHKLRSVVDIKKDICLKTKIPVNRIRLSMNGKCLEKNVNFFKLGIQNGTLLKCSLF